MHGTGTFSLTSNYHSFSLCIFPCSSDEMIVSNIKLIKYPFVLAETIKQHLVTTPNMVVARAGPDLSVVIRRVSYGSLMIDTAAAFIIILSNKSISKIVIDLLSVS